MGFGQTICIPGNMVQAQEAGHILGQIAFNSEAQRIQAKALLEKTYFTQYDTTWEIGDRVKTDKPLSTVGVIRDFVKGGTGTMFAWVQCLSTGIHYAATYDALKLD